MRVETQAKGRERNSRRCGLTFVRTGPVVAVLGHLGPQGNKGTVFATKAVDTHKAKALSSP